MLGLGAFLGGLMFMLAPLGTTIAAPLAGRAADRLGSRGPMVVGLVIEAVALASTALSHRFLNHVQSLNVVQACVKPWDLTGRQIRSRRGR